MKRSNNAKNSAEQQEQRTARTKGREEHCRATDLRTIADFTHAYAKGEANAELNVSPEQVMIGLINLPLPNPYIKRAIHAEAVNAATSPEASRRRSRDAEDTESEGASNRSPCETINEKNDSFMYFSFSLLCNSQELVILSRWYVRPVEQQVLLQCNK